MAVYMWVCVCLWVYLYHGDLLGPECCSQFTGQHRDIWEDFFTWSWCGQTPRRLRQSSGWSWSSIGHPASDGEWEERQRQKNQWAGEVSLFPWSSWFCVPCFFFINVIICRVGEAVQTCYVFIPFLLPCLSFAVKIFSVSAFDEVDVLLGFFPSFEFCVEARCVSRWMAF